MAIKQGEILYIDLKYTDYSGSKERPCLVISNSALSSIDDVIVLKITHSEFHGFSYKITNEMLSNKGIDGYIELKSVQSLSIHLFDKKRQRVFIKPEYLKEILEKFSENIEFEE